MRRADRLFGIVQHFRGGRRVTARRLAERLEVSERTIYRDIADRIAELADRGDTFRPEHGKTLRDFVARMAAEGRCVEIVSQRR